MRALLLSFVTMTLAACATAPAPIAGFPSASPAAPSSAYGEPRIVEGAAPEQCVPFARSASGIELYGDASTWWAQADGRYPRSNIPAVGSVLVMHGYSDATRGHVAVVAAIISSREILVDQANWLNQGEISLSVPVADVSPNNDWSEVRVWYIPDNHWGGRTYQADGFIHPVPLPAV